METQELRAIASAFLTKHGHPGYAKMIEQRCAFEVVRSLLKRHGKKELLRLYPLMSKDLKQGFLFWFPPVTKELKKKLQRIDREYKGIRDYWLRWGTCKSLPKSEVKDYFRKLRVVILAWLKGK